MSKIIYKNGQKINDVVLVKDLGNICKKESSSQLRRYGIFMCACGDEFETEIDTVKSGKKSLCNKCSSKKRISKSITHGLSHSRIHNIWTGMKNRCNNKNVQCYRHYGGRGISYCKEWEIFDNFYLDMKDGYSDNLTLDRKNSIENYSKENCRWVTILVQARNTKKIQKNNKSGYRGIYSRDYGGKYRASIGVDNKRINLGTFSTKLEAAKAYDKYVIDNNLEHTINGV